MFLFSFVKPKGHPVISGVNAETGQYVLTFSLVTWVKELSAPNKTGAVGGAVDILLALLFRGSSEAGEMG